MAVNVSNSKRESAPNNVVNIDVIVPSPYAGYECENSTMDNCIFGDLVSN
jgi:hypothetical protein